MTSSLAADLFGTPTDTTEPPAARVLDLRGDEEEARTALIAALDQALGVRRLPVAAGTVLLEEGEELGGLFIIVDGTITLSRHTGDTEVLHHAGSTGPIVGLSVLQAGTRSQFTCRARTAATLIPVSFDELDGLLAVPAIAGTFVNALVRSLSRRHRRSVELQARVEMLYRSLAHERDQLADALDALDAAQTRMVESARMATLGELAAGIAHELNNPVAAILRSLDHAIDDVVDLLDAADAEQGLDLRAHLDRARSTVSASTAEQRTRRRALTDRVGPDLADRLVDAGLTDPGELDRLVALPARQRDEHLAVLATVWSLGTWIRNLTTASRRVADLVSSLRNYARPDTDPIDGIDLIEQLDDSLRLFHGRLDGVDVERRWDGVPPVRGWPGALHQVWSNLIANAADALDGSGHLVVEAVAVEPDRVRVRMIDDGPGIPPDLLDRLFEPRFTTKAGRVQFGLGLGLSLVRQAVVRHGGTIDVESEPGRTCVSVELPVDGPTGEEPA